MERAGNVATDDETGLSEALGGRLLSEVAQLGGGGWNQRHVPQTTRQLRVLGVTDVILYPLGSGRGWRDALDRTLDELAPAR